MLETALPDCSPRRKATTTYDLALAHIINRRHLLISAVAPEFPFYWFCSQRALNGHETPVPFPSDIKGPHLKPQKAERNNKADRLDQER